MASWKRESNIIFYGYVSLLLGSVSTYVLSFLSFFDAIFNASGRFSQEALSASGGTQLLIGSFVSIIFLILMLVFGWKKNQRPMMIINLIIGIIMTVGVFSILMVFIFGNGGLLGQICMLISFIIFAPLGGIANYSILIAIAVAYEMTLAVMLSCIMFFKKQKIDSHR